MPKPKSTTTAKDAQSNLIDVGRKALTFSLKDQHGKAHKPSDYAGQWVVLYFYPKDDTPGCTTEACDFRDSSRVLEQHGAVVLGVSPDDEASHAKFADKFSLPFSLLADHDAKVAKKYGVWREKNMYGRKSMGIVRTTYLIDPAGKVAHRWDHVRAKGHTATVLKKLHELAG